jgi:hypothetical protein
VQRERACALDHPSPEPLRGPLRTLRRIGQGWRASVGQKRLQALWEPRMHELHYVACCRIMGLAANRAAIRRMHGALGVGYGPAPDPVASVYAQAGVIGRIRPRYTPQIKPKTTKSLAIASFTAPAIRMKPFGAFLLSLTCLARSFGLPFSFMYTNSSSR